MFSRILLLTSVTGLSIAPPYMQEKLCQPMGLAAFLWESPSDALIGHPQSQTPS